MRIQDLRAEKKKAAARVSAVVVWEDCDRPAQDIYFETTEAFASVLSCNPHAFLVACLTPAMRHGERRIAIAEEICPELRNGLVTAMAWLHSWYGARCKPVQIESKVQTRWQRRTTERVGAFLSGGIDSLATLRINRLHYPLEHPYAIKNCLFVYGFDIGGVARDGENLAVFERALTLLSNVVDDAKITLIPVFTNIRHLDDDVQFWMYEFHGAALASVAHAFSGQFTRVHIAATYDIPNIKPWGSHPLLDPNYSSADLQIVHDGVRFSRLDKVRLVADWEVALRQLRVCTENESGMLNCGKCEKCIRTMVELLAIGRLAHTQVFPVADVSKELLGRITIETGYQDACYRELIAPLRAIGRSDLADVIQTKSERYHKHLNWLAEKDWKGIVKRFDRKHLSGSLFNAYKAFRERLTAT